MVKFCCLKSCPNRDLQSSKGKNVARQSFPEDPNVRSKWVEFVNRHNRMVDFQAPAHRSGCYICSAHFEPSCFRISKLNKEPSKLVQKNAFPTIVPRYTPELALKFGLIPSLNSNLLEIVNNFEISVEDFLKAAADNVEELRQEERSVDAVLCGSGADGHSTDYMDVTLEEESPPNEINGENYTESAPLLVNGFANQSVGPSTPVSRKRKSYVGDMSPGDVATPRRAEKVLKFMKQSHYDVKKKQKITQMRLRRALHKFNNLKSLLQHLKDERRIPNDIADMLEAKLSFNYNNDEVDETCARCGRACMWCDFQ